MTVQSSVSSVYSGWERRVSILSWRIQATNATGMEIELRKSLPIQHILPVRSNDFKAFHSLKWGNFHSKLKQHGIVVRLKLASCEQAFTTNNLALVHVGRAQSSSVLRNSQRL